MTVSREKVMGRGNIGCEKDSRVGRGQIRLDLTFTVCWCVYVPGQICDCVHWTCVQQVCMPTRLHCLLRQQGGGGGGRGPGYIQQLGHDWEHGWRTYIFFTHSLKIKKRVLAITLCCRQQAGRALWGEWQSMLQNAWDKSFLSRSPAGIDKPGMHLDSPIKMVKWSNAEALYSTVAPLYPLLPGAPQRPTSPYSTRAVEERWRRKGGSRWFGRVTTVWHLQCGGRLRLYEELFYCED